MIELHLPWHTNEDPAPGWEGYVYDSRGMIAARANTQESARRIAACVNACIGAETDELEKSCQELAERIHYPRCWDTAAYPTLHDALLEVTASCGCSECNTATAFSWKPIETAPKDRRILVRTDVEIYAATWSQNPLTGDVAFCVGRITNPASDDDQMLVYPKEWMELPIAAQKKEGDLLWSIYIPGPDEYHAAPSEDAARQMAIRHNDAMAKYLEKKPLNEFSPSLESISAMPSIWPFEKESHAAEIAEFDYEGWGIVQKKEGGEK